MKKVLIIGFQPYDERMYPHSYDFISLVKAHCELTYFGGDDRGYESYKMGLNAQKLLRASEIVNSLDAFYRNYRSIIENKNQIKALMNANFDIVIAIDHSALNQACFFLRENTKLIFWSNDIISHDHVWMNSYWVRRILRKNMESIKKCDLIIIQDENRAAVLDSVLKSHHVAKFYLPVSLKTDEFSKSVARAKFKKVLNGKIVLMQLGSMIKARGTDRLIKAYQSMGDKVSLILQGRVAPDIARLIEGGKRKPELYQLFDNYIEMRRNISRFDIGFISIAVKNLNNHFASKASGQLVEYLRLGIPVIVFDVEELGRFVENNNCGLQVTHIDQLESTVQDIADNYRKYSMSSVKTFDAIFDMELYSDKLIKCIFQ